MDVWLAALAFFLGFLTSELRRALRRPPNVAPAPCVVDVGIASPVVVKADTAAAVVNEHAVYLLQSEVSELSYIGYSADWRRRLRQHNRELSGGARTTEIGRPWRVVCVIGGFETKKAALQFEWAWQHPVQSVTFRRVLGASDSKTSVARLNMVKNALKTPVVLEKWPRLCMIHP